MEIVFLLLLALHGTHCFFDDTIYISNGTAAGPDGVIHINVTHTILSEHIKANDGDFPYMASLQLRNMITSHGHRCGGVLVTLQHVITAASCLFDKFSIGDPVPLDIKLYRVFAGDTGLSNDYPERVRLIANYTIHPEFVPDDKHLNDIAILTLESPFVVSYGLKPLPLPDQDHSPNDHMYEDMRADFCKVSGWGQITPNSDMHDSLKYVPKSVRNLDYCKTLYSEMVHSPDADRSMVCGVPERPLTYGCHGDEGDPLVCKNRLVGILFLSHKCEISSDPQLYTRVSHYSNWARSVIGDTDAKKSSSVFQSSVTLVIILAVTQLITSKFNLPNPLGIQA